MRLRRGNCSEVAPAGRPRWLKDRSLEGSSMQKVTLIAGIASLAAAAAMFSMPVAAEMSSAAPAHQAFDKWPGDDRFDNKSVDQPRQDEPGTGVPEPGTLA